MGICKGELVGRDVLRGIGEICGAAVERIQCATLRQCGMGICSADLLGRDIVNSRDESE